MIGTEFEYIHPEKLNYRNGTPILHLKCNPPNMLYLVLIQSIISESFASFVTRKTGYFGTRVDTIKSRDS